MTSENIENIKKTYTITGRTTKITSKITERTTGTRFEKKPISHQKMSDSVPNCKHRLQKLKTQASGFIVSFSVFSCFPVVSGK